MNPSSLVTTKSAFKKNITAFIGLHSLFPLFFFFLWKLHSRPQDFQIFLSAGTKAPTQNCGVTLIWICSLLHGEESKDDTYFRVLSSFGQSSFSRNGVSAKLQRDFSHSNSFRNASERHSCCYDYKAQKWVRQTTSFPKHIKVKLWGRVLRMILIWSRGGELHCWPLSNIVGASWGETP